jgi:hypothetical protein
MTSPKFKLKKRWHTSCYDNLNALGWPAGFGVVSHGARIGIRTNDPDVIPLIRSRLPCHAQLLSREVEFDCVMSVINGGSSEGKRVRKFSLLYQNHTRLSRLADFAGILDDFEMYFAATEAALAPRRTFIHAGVVGYLGHAILIPGLTYSGKSTLVSELVQWGATYYSDEYAVIDKLGRVHPYARPISLRNEDGGSVSYSAESLGGTVGRTPLPVGMLVFTEYKLGTRWSPKRVNSSQAFLDLLANCVSARIAPRRVFSCLEKLATSPIRIKGPRPEAEVTARKIFRLMEDLTTEVYVESGARREWPVSRLEPASSATPKNSNRAIYENFGLRSPP